MSAVSLFCFAFFLVGVLSQLTFSNCPSDNDYIQQFNAASTEWNITKSSNKSFCHMQLTHDNEQPTDGDGQFDENGHPRTKRNNDDYNCTSCVSIYRMCRSIILGLNLTTEECLEEHHHQHSNETSSKSKTAEVYGYGFLMITLVSLCSLIGILLVPLINGNSKIGRQTYEYVYAFMIAIGISALMSDAVLHLIPHFHDSHNTGKEEESQNFIWKSCLILFGLYAFFLLEVALHGIRDWLKEKSKKNCHTDDHDDQMHSNYSACESNDIHYSSIIPTQIMEVETDQDSQKIPLTTNLSDKNCTSQHSSINNDDNKSADERPYFLRIQPVGWLIIVGDALHNFGDGLALGASIVQSLTLGVSTMFALVFHEIPHELGDYVILIKSGMHWATALILNFISSLTAIIGFFIGVAISSYSASANGWILALTAGLFIYISMTDLFPVLIQEARYVHKNRSGWRLLLKFILTNLGFLISFAFLLILAIYGKDLNNFIK